MYDEISSEGYTLDQGSIVQSEIFSGTYDTNLAILLTPRCDIAQDKVDFALLCAMASPMSVMSTQGWAPSGTKAGDELSKILRWDHPRWHWLGPREDLIPDGAIVDFQAIASLRFDSMDAELVVAQVASPYREHLAQRYSAYVGRVGVDELEGKEERTKRKNALVNAYKDSLGSASKR